MLNKKCIYNINNFNQRVIETCTYFKGDLISYINVIFTLSITYLNHVNTIIF